MRTVPGTRSRAASRVAARAGGPALLLATALLLPACAPTGTVTSPTTVGGPAGQVTTVGTAATAGTQGAAEVRLSAAVVQYRRDAQRDVLQVKVTNAGDAPVRITRVELETPTFTAPAAAAKDSTVGPGLTADLTVPLGEPACDGGDGPALAHLTVARGAAEQVVTVETGQGGAGGTAGQLRTGSGADVLAVIRDERCAVAAVGEHVELRVAPGWADAGVVGGEPALRGSLEATPLPGAPELTLAVDGATTLFTVAEAARAVLPVGSVEPVLLDVVLTVTRCDPHAVAEDKKGYLLPARVAVGDAEAVLVEVPVAVADRGPLQELIDRSCR